MHHLWVEGEGVQGDQGFGPFHAFGNAGGALESAREGLASETTHKLCHLFSELRAGLRHLRPDHGQLALAIGVVHPLIEASAFHGIVQIAGSIAGENGDRRYLGFDGA